MATDELTGGAIWWFAASEREDVARLLLFVKSGDIVAGVTGLGAYPPRT
jgi:hypothetical protein